MYGEMPRSEDEIVIGNKLPVKREVQAPDIKAKYPDVIEQATNTVADYQLYDESPADDGGLHFELNEGLTDWEIADAIKMQPYILGMLLVTGPPRSGKDLFANMWAWKIRRYYKSRHILRDEKPRRAFGEYTPFNEYTLANEIRKLKIMASFNIEEEIANSSKKAKLDLENTLSGLVASGNIVNLKNGVLYLTEFGRYFDKRHPHNPMGMALGRVLKIWGHLGLLIIGTTQKKHDLDIYRCTPYITCEARCAWHFDPEPHTIVRIFRIQSVSPNGVMNVKAKKPFTVRIWLNRPQPQLGGLCWKDLYVTQSMPNISTGSIKI